MLILLYTFVEIHFNLLVLKLLTSIKLNISKFGIILYLCFQSGKVGPGRVPGRQEPEAFRPVQVGGSRRPTGSRERRLHPDGRAKSLKRSRWTITMKCLTKCSLHMWMDWPISWLCFIIKNKLSLKFELRIGLLYGFIYWWYILSLNIWN